MPAVTLEHAEELLRKVGGYDWVLSGKKLWSAAEVTEQLTRMGMRVQRETIGNWFKSDLPSYLDYGKLGLFATREQLIVFLASRIVEQQDQSHHA